VEIFGYFSDGTVLPAAEAVDLPDAERQFVDGFFQGAVEVFCSTSP